MKERQTADYQPKAIEVGRCAVNATALFIWETVAVYQAGAEWCAPTFYLRRFALESDARLAYEMASREAKAQLERETRRAREEAKREEAEAARKEREAEVEERRLKQEAEAARRQAERDAAVTTSSGLNLGDLFGGNASVIAVKGKGGQSGSRRRN